MAFSTQKDFLTFNFPMNRKKSENQIKTFESCTDTRAWSMDNTKRAKYLADIVQKMKQMPVSVIDGAGDGRRYFSEAELEQMSQSELFAHVLDLYKNIQSKDNELKATEKLLKDAAEKFESIDEVLRENKELRNEIKASREKIQQLERKNGDELLEKVEMIYDLRTENTNLKTQLVSVQSSIEEISELRKRSEILDKVIQERQNLTEKMRKMEMVEDAIIRLKEKALMTDQLTEENQKLCQVLEKLKTKLQEDTGDTHNAKLEAQNRFMKDRLSQVESLIEEIAIYKAENVELHRQINDLRQKIINLKIIETELHQTRELLRRRNAEVEDCENVIQACMIKINRQDREIKLGAKRMHELCKMQRDLEMLHERMGIAYLDDDQGICGENDEKERIVEVQPVKENVAQEKVMPITEEIRLKEKDVDYEEKNVDSEDLQKVQNMNEKLTSEIQEYQNKIKSLESQLIECQSKIQELNESFEIQANELRANEGMELGQTLIESDNLHEKCLHDISLLENQIKLCQQTKDDLTKQLNDRENEIQTMKLQTSDLESKINNLQQELQTKEDIVLDFSKQEPMKIDTSMNDSMQLEIKELQTKCNSLQKENDDLRTELEKLKFELEKEKSSALHASNTLKSQIEALNAEKDSCQGLLKQVQTEKDSLQKQITEIGAVTKDLEQEMTKNDSLENERIKELEDEVNRLNEQLQKEIKKTKEYEAWIEKAKANGYSDEDKQEQTPETPTIENVIDKELTEVVKTDFSKESSQLQEEKEEEEKVKSVEDKIDSTLDKSRKSKSVIEVRQSHEKDLIRKSYQSEVSLISHRFDTKIQELQDLHDLEKQELSKKHDAEMDAMRLQMEALENELKKIDERCKCGVKRPPSMYNTDERLAKICRDVQEFGLEPCLMTDLLYLKDQTTKAIIDKEKKIKAGRSNTRLEELLDEFTKNFMVTADNVRNLKQLADDDVPVKIPAKKIPFTQPVPSDVDSFFGISKQKPNSRKSQPSSSHTTNKPRTSRNNTRVTSLNISKDRSSNSKSGQTNVLYYYGNKTIKITDKSDNEPQSNSKTNKGQQRQR